MKIYTKKGDAGQTELFGGAKVSKADLRIQTYGVFDELNAILGLILAESARDGIGLKGEESLPPETRAQLLQVQNDLFRLGAELATPAGRKPPSDLIEDSEVAILEREIDLMEAELSPLKTFILPGGSRAAALLHLARTVCRRSERELALLHEAEEVRGPVLRYVNRLSDYFFVAARFMNKQVGVADVPWIAKR